MLCAATAANAGFYNHFNMHRHHFTIDMDGFHNHGHQHGHHHQHGFHRFGPPPPVYGPPPFAPPFHHGHHQHSHQCNHKPDNGLGMISLTTSTNPFIPIIPNMNHPFNQGANFPFNPQNPFLNPQNTNQIGGNIPSNTKQNNCGDDTINNPSNLPNDPLPTSQSTYDTNTVTPLDAGTALNGQTSNTPPSIFDENPSSPTQTKGIIFMRIFFDIFLHSFSLTHIAYLC